MPGSDLFTHQCEKFRMPGPLAADVSLGPAPSAGQSGSHLCSRTTEIHAASSTPSAPTPTDHAPAAALTPGPSPNDWDGGPGKPPLACSPSPSCWERGPGGEGRSHGQPHRSPHGNSAAPCSRSRRGGSHHGDHPRLPYQVRFAPHPWGNGHAPGRGWEDDHDHRQAVLAGQDGGHLGRIRHLRLPPGPDRRREDEGS